MPEPRSGPRLSPGLSRCVTSWRSEKYERCRWPARMLLAEGNIHAGQGTFLARKRSGLYPRLAVAGEGKRVVSGAGGVLLPRPAATVGLDAGLRAALSPGGGPLTRHDPGRVQLDLAIS